MSKTDVCSLMRNLRKGLDERSIKWSDHTERDIVDMERTKFTHNGTDYSVIWGNYSYGYPEYLECMVDSDEPEPLGVEEILEMVDENGGKP